MMILMGQATIVDAYVTPGTERETVLTPADLLPQMDAAGIDRALIAPQDREIAVDNALGNRRILDLAAGSRGRFIPACTINPWFGAKAVEGLNEAVASGAKVLVVAPALQGFMLSDPLADALMTRAGELGIPVYVHTGPHSAATPTQLALVAMRLPRTRFILGHCGSTDYSHDMATVFSMQLENLWYELSFVRPWSLRRYVSLAKSNRVIFGSSAPRNDPGFELSCCNANYPIAEFPEVYGSNFLKLIGEEP